MQDIVRQVIRDIGYTKAEYRFDAESCSVISSIHSQSPDIAQGVDTGGAGDQGMMFGYASNETPEYMPMPIMFAHKLVKRLADIRKKQPQADAVPPSRREVAGDGRVQRRTPVRVHTVVVSTQHDPDVSQKKICNDVVNNVIIEVIPEELLDKKTDHPRQPDRAV